MAGLFHSFSGRPPAMPPQPGRVSHSAPPLDDIKWPASAFLRSLPFLSVTKMGLTAWRFVWAATTGPYRIYLGGQLLDTIDGTEWEADILEYPDYPPPIEVLDTNGALGDVEHYIHPPYAELQWYGDASAAVYYVEEKTGSASYTRRQIINEVGVGYYLFRTPVLLEGLNEWRVIPVDSAGNEGTALDFSFNIVPPPLPPETVPITFSGGAVVAGP